MLKIESEITELMNFLETSPTAWHAVAFIVKKFKKEGFEILEENQPWKLELGKAYVVVRNGSSLVAFVMPSQPIESVKVVGAHTDSPALKLKPNAEYLKENMVMLGVEVYGGPLLTSWLNRDLGIAGRAFYKDAKKNRQEALVNLSDQPVVLPQLAIHLDRNVNESGPALNKQDHLAVLAALQTNPKSSKGYLETMLQEALNFHTLLGYDLFVYPLEKPRLIGNKGQLLSSYRLDNLASVHAGLAGLIKGKRADKNTLKMAAFWDHEEIGSHTAQGAGSPFLPQTIERICGSREDYFRVMSQGLCVSVDMTHALHPNYPEKSEPRHQLLMDGGIVIKTSAQHRYASDARTVSIIVDLCTVNKIPYQHFVSRGDISSGTTIGPIHATLTGMPTVDIGCPQLSMHSCRELFSCNDHLNMCKLLYAFLK
jgi:aspartyl aminopeptidase